MLSESGYNPGLRATRPHAGCSPRPSVRNNLTVAAPPPVSAGEALAAIERIRARRTEIDDPNLWRLSDEPVDVLAFLRRYSSGVPRWVAQADVLDGLTLRLRVWWLGEEAELWLLEAARRVGVPPNQVGRRLGVSSRQGVHDRLRLARGKLERLTGEPHPSFDPARSADEREVERAWLQAHRAEIRTMATEAVGFRELADDDAAEWLADVAQDLRDGAVTPGSFQTLRFALAELAVSSAALETDADHPLRELLLRWARLYGSRPA